MTRQTQIAALALMIPLALTPTFASPAPGPDDALDTAGGTGGPLIVVDTLEDLVAEDGRTSLREAVLTPGKRVIEIRVQGVIHLQSPLHLGGDPALEEFRGRDNPYGEVTILGPRGGDGVVIADHPLVIGNGVADVVLRYLRFRAPGGDDADPDAGGSPATGVQIGHAHRVVGSFRGER